MSFLCCDSLLFTVSIRLTLFFGSGLRSTSSLDVQIDCPSLPPFLLLPTLAVLTSSLGARMLSDDGS